MKNKKLSLNSLEVKSFVTNLKTSNVDTVKGGLTSITRTIGDLTGTIIASGRTDIGCCPDVR